MASNNIPLNTSVVSAVVLSHSGGGTKMLMLHRAEERFWCHIAGKIEKGESAWQAILREIEEETGITDPELYAAEYLEQFYEPVRNCITIIPVFVACVSNNVPIRLNEEHTDFKWCTLDEAKSLAPYPNQHAVYEHVWQHFVTGTPSEFMKISIVQNGQQHE